MFESLLSAASLVVVALVAYVAWMFGSSLLPGSTPLVARFAAAEDPDTSHRPDLQKYLRRLTLIWALLLSACSIIAMARVFGPHSPQLLVVYSAVPAALIVTLFIGERQLRALLFGASSVSPLRDQYRTATRILHEQMRPASNHFAPTERVSPVFALPDMERPLVVGPQGMCTVYDMERAATRLSVALPAGRRVAVLCEDRTLFLVAVLTCWAARRTVMLPPADVAGTRETLALLNTDAVITDQRVSFSVNRTVS